MRETNTYTETITKEETLSITCDCCGKIEEGDYVEHSSSIETWQHEFGYGSRFDTDQVSFDICDDCYEKWINTFTHPPQNSNQD